jgi:hypothetical protein
MPRSSRSTAEDRRAGMPDAVREQAERRARPARAHGG